MRWPPRSRRAWFTTIRRADHLFHLEQFDYVAGLILRFMARTLGTAEEEGWHEVETIHARTAASTAASGPRVS